MVRLHQHRIAARWNIVYAVDALDDIQLPRWTGEVQRTGKQTRRLDAQLPPIARFGKRKMAHVKLEIELGVTYPIWMVEIHRDAHQSFAKHRRKMKTAFDILQDASEGDATTASRRLVVDVQTRPIQGRMRLLLVDERSVLPTELSHAVTSVYRNEAKL